MTSVSSDRSGAPGSQILVVSADTHLREFLYDLLTAHAYRVSTAASGKTGTEAMLHERPDLIFIDSSANNCEGWNFPDWVRRFNQKVPIISLGHPGEDAPDPRTARDIQAYLPEATETALLGTMARWIVQGRSDNPTDQIDFPGTILAIDDERGYLLALEDFLQPRNCDVVLASSGEEGLEMLKRHRPALVLLDVKMPGMDGLLTLKKIKERRPDVHVVMTTAADDRDLIAQAFALGATEYIVKPYDMKALRTTLIRLKQTLDQS